MLRWKNLDLKNRVRTVAESKTEAGKGRPVLLTQHAWAALDIWASRVPDRNLEHFVFPTLAAVATTEIQSVVNQIVHQAEREVESKMPNILILRQ